MMEDTTRELLRAIRQWLEEDEDHAPKNLDRILTLATEWEDDGFPDLD